MPRTFWAFASLSLPGCTDAVKIMLVVASKTLVLRGMFESTWPASKNHGRVDAVYPGLFEVRAPFAAAVDACRAGSQACALVKGRLVLGVFGG